jgi:N-acetylneuraminic acid mutarotase
MKSNLGLWIPAVMLLTTAGAPAQSTAFTYQGRLQDGTNHASGFYDLTFGVWTNAAGPAQMGATVTNFATGVTNGLFTVTLDFGSGVFDGNPRWLEIGVRTNGSGAFTKLLPRQSLNAAPYAIFAGGVSAAGITGTIPAASIGVGTITSNMLAPGAAAANLAASDQSTVPSGGMVLSSSQDATKLLALGYSRFGGPLELSWQNVAGSQSLAPRGNHTAVWTGSRMIVWGGVDNTGLNPKNTGNMYDPNANEWLSVTTNNAPAGRSGHTAIWTGSEMIIWGGYSDGYLNDGGRFNPLSGTWLPVSTSNAPSARRYHTAVWTGSEMIVWGGNGDGDTMLDSGGRYIPATDTWFSLNATNAPAGRILHTAVWSGNEMIVWGGLYSVVKLSNDGARYNPNTDAWSPVTTNAAPTERAYHVAVWTDNGMVVWGGQGQRILADGCRYTPSTDTWAPVTQNGAPIPRCSPSSVWTGSEMIIWAGSGGGGYINDGARYNPVNDTWSVVPTTGAPSVRQGHTAVWTGSEMVVFGGYNNVTTLGDCYSFAPSRVMYLYLRR